MDFDKLLETISKKIREMDVDNRKIIVWGMGHEAALYDNAFRTEEISVYAYTSKDARGGVSTVAFRLFH